MPARITRAFSFHIDLFTADSSGDIDDKPDYNAAGNLTYDGIYEFTYDAWNRLVKTTKAFKDDSGTMSTASVVCEAAYDGLNRRIVKQVKNSADLNATYHYYCDGARVAFQTLIA